MQSMSCDLREGTEYRPSGSYYTLHQAVDCMLVDNWWYTPVHDTVLATQPCYIHQPEMWLQIPCLSTLRGLSTRLDAVSYPYVHRHHDYMEETVHLCVMLGWSLCSIAA